VASDNKKQRHGGYDLAAGCDDFSTEREHGRRDWIPRGVKSNSKIRLLPRCRPGIRRACCGGCGC
jgi:hypothetical protein